MGRTSAATSAVREALDDLGNILLPQPLQNRGWDADPRALNEAWANLNGCLHDAGELIKRPQPGQGLESAWLRAVCIAVADVESALRQWHFGWQDVIRHGNADLDWLIDDLRHAGERLIGGNYEGRGDVLGLLGPDEPPLSRLRRLASSWTAQLGRGPNEPAGLVPIREQDYWEQRKKLQDAYLRRTGELVLQAVDSMDINSSLLNDRHFLRCVMHSIDFPAYFPLEMLKENKTSEALTALIERLEPEKTCNSPGQEVDAARNSTELGSSTAVTIVVNGRTKTYSTPKNYPRDKWIYENIHLHDYQSLSKMLQNIAEARKWKIIEARNSFKVAADRYADFHEIEQRRFPDDRMLS